MVPFFSCVKSTFLTFCAVQMCKAKQLCTKFKKNAECNGPKRNPRVSRLVFSRFVLGRWVRFFGTGYACAGSQLRKPVARKKNNGRNRTTLGL